MVVGAFAGTAAEKRQAGGRGEAASRRGQKALEQDQISSLTSLRHCASSDPEQTRVASTGARRSKPRRLPAQRCLTSHPYAALARRTATFTLHARPITLRKQPATPHTIPAADDSTALNPVWRM
jgi:hypothetical protein